MRHILVCLVLLGGFAVPAENLELWNRKTIRDVEIVKAERGWLYYKKPDGKVSKAKLIDIKTIDYVDRFCKITKFEDSTFQRRDGKLITISITADAERIREPLLRVYVIEEGRKGERNLRLYQNVRIYDPTRVEKLPEVESKVYAEKSFFLERTDGIAYRIEIWFKGKLRTFRNVKDSDMERDWWRSMKLTSTGSLRSLTGDDAEKVEEVAEENAEDRKNIRADCRIETFSLNPEPKKKHPQLKVKYSLGSPRLNSVKTPKVQFHYVTETGGGEREIASINCQSGGRRVKLSRGLYVDTIERNLPTNIRLHPSLTELKKEGVARLIYWRLEFLDEEDNVLRAKEPPYHETKRGLPANWWK